MELLRGEDLKVRLARGPIPVPEACDVLDGIARALDAAHAKDIVHRDLKPDNVFLHKVEDGPVMVKLLDFGIAKLIKQGGGGMERTNTGDMLGTPRYISPEQARGVNVDHRSDIYSLGVMAYEMLAARAPFHGETAMDLVVAHMQEEPPALSQFARVPKPLEHCVMRMLDKDPSKRPPLADVRNILIDPTRRNTPASGLRQSMSNLAPVSSTPRWLVAAAAVVGAVVIASVTWMIAADRQASATPAAAAAPIVTAPSVEARAPAPPVQAAPPVKPAAPEIEMPVAPPPVPPAVVAPPPPVQVKAPPRPVARPQSTVTSRPVPPPPTTPATPVVKPPPPQQANDDDIMVPQTVKKRP
jgi:serine/threonine-protein kinase